MRLWCCEATEREFPELLFLGVYRGRAGSCVQWGILPLCPVIPALWAWMVLFTSIIQLRWVIVLMLNSFDCSLPIYHLYSQAATEWWDCSVEIKDANHHQLYSVESIGKRQSGHFLLDHLAEWGFQAFSRELVFSISGPKKEKRSVTLSNLKLILKLRWRRVDIQQSWRLRMRSLSLGSLWGQKMVEYRNWAAVEFGNRYSKCGDFAYLCTQ